MIGKSRKYGVLSDNCHQFTSGCITGDFENEDNLLFRLKGRACNELNVNEWRVWDRVYGESKEASNGFIFEQQ